jgi:hypothetical protein
MKKLILSVVMCVFILLAGCSQEQPDLQVPKQIDGKASLNTPSHEQTAGITNEGTGTTVEEETIAVKAIKSFYGNTDQSIIIYEQIPFENDCELVLADRLMDGEHYPNLYLVSPDGRVLALSRHSYCWTLNYTQYGDYRIFFGLAGRETYQFNKKSLSVKKIEAVFADKRETVETRENIIAHINPRQNDTRVVKSTQAYIMPVKDQDMPDNVLGIFSDGETVSLSQISIDRSLEYMPEYFKVEKRNIYNAFAFTYSPMMSPVDWKQIDSEGETALTGKTDENGNLNAIILRPSPTVFKAIHSSQFPFDMKSFYLSNSYPWTAAFSAGERVAAVYAKDKALFDYRVIKLTPKILNKEIGIKDSQLLKKENNQITLPKEPGYYLFLLRTEKYSELRSHMGVIRIR